MTEATQPQEPREKRPTLLRLFDDLRRRNVLRTVAAYAVAAWVVIEVVDTVGPALAFPAGSTRLVVYAALLALPLVVALAWMFDVAPEVREQRPARSSLIVLAAAAPLLLGGITALTNLFREGELDAETAAGLLVEANELAAAGRYAEAYPLVERAAAVLPVDSAVVALREEVSVRVNVQTEPHGATIRALPFTALEAAPGGAWEDWGEEPVEGRRVPRVDHLIVARLDGYRSAERLASPSFRYVERTRYDVSAIDVTVPLEPADSDAPSDMVRVPGGEYEIASPDMPNGLSAPIDEFFIDRFEVTNRQYREFVAAGGYADRELWSDLPPDVNHSEVMARLVDETGVPGPRGWRDQRHPDGQAEFPVTGVTWYEAAAYAAYRGRALPTLHQWEKAARDGATTGRDGYVLPWGFVRGGERTAHRSRFQAPTPGPVDEHPFGISPYGAYAMAGNVKEWLANPRAEGRAVTGGSWQDPIYLFSAVGGHDALFASPALGFRTVWLDPDRRRLSRDQALMPLDVTPASPAWQPVQRSTFEVLLSHYRYDRRAVAAEVVETVEAPDWDRQKIEYDGPGGERVTGYLYLPRGSLPPYQPILYVPSNSAFVSDVPEGVEYVVGPLISGGRAVFTLVMKGMTGRENPTDYEPPPTGSVAFRDRMVLHATEMRLGLDYLETRDDVDMERLSYVGLSWGAGSRLGFAALDERFRAVVFIGGGIDERIKPVLPEADNVNFAPRIDVPKLLINGRQDEEHPWLTRGRALWDLLSEPKRLVLLEGEGHLPRSERLIPAIESFLNEIVGPVERPEDRPR